MIHPTTTETQSRWRRHIHKQARLVLPQTVLLRIVSLRFFVRLDPLNQTISLLTHLTAARFVVDHLPEIRLRHVVSVAWLFLMPPPLSPIKTPKTNGGSL